MPVARIKAVIFDFGGVICFPPSEAQWQEAAAFCGADRHKLSKPPSGKIAMPTMPAKIRRCIGRVSPTALGLHFDDAMIDAMIAARDRVSGAASTIACSAGSDESARARASARDSFESATSDWRERLKSHARISRPLRRGHVLLRTGRRQAGAGHLRKCDRRLARSRPARRCSSTIAPRTSKARAPSGLQRRRCSPRGRIFSRRTAVKTRAAFPLDERAKSRDFRIAFAPSPCYNPGRTYGLMNSSSGLPKTLGALRLSPKYQTDAQRQRRTARKPDPQAGKEGAAVSRHRRL